MIGFKRLIFAAIFAALLTACAKSEIEIPVKTGQGISFRPWAVTTKAQSLTNDAVNPFKTLGVYAAATGSDDYNSATHTANYLQNIKVERLDVASGWTTSQSYYWPVGKTTFFGYAPYNAAGSVITNAAPGAPIIDFTVDSDPAKQIDLLIASTVKDATNTLNAVTIPMKHALTKIGFSAKLSHELSAVPNINFLKVARIEISGVYSSAKHTMDTESVWTDLKDIKAQAFTVNAADQTLGGLRSVNLGTAYQRLTLDDGYLFMLPQSFTEGAKLRVYLVAEWRAGNEEVAFDTPIEFDLAQTGLNWNQGEAINYNINIDLTDRVQVNSTLSAELVPWSETEIDSDLTKRQLNLTRIEADVFDAAITRVYFSSNQPVNEVYISPICYEGTLPSAGGAAKGVQEIFNNLTAPNPWEAQNLHYDADTEQGYFELDRVNSNSAPQSYLLYVHAGGLRRSVQVNIKNTDYPLPTGNATSPFVGTFHRFDEFGERIITWNNDGPWIAVIEPLNSHQDPNGGGGYADYADVIFDRQVSPAQESGILHTSSPGNAEDYPVTDSWDREITIDGKPTRVLMGNGKIYLRIGWKRSAGAGTSRNRYAKITVRSALPDAPNSNVLGTLFIRKGEAPDYLMRQGDPIQGVYTASTRKDVVKFSPYDVTSPYGNELKNIYYDYPVIPSGGGQHLRYPTHGGSYFRWGSGRGISSLTGRFSESPLVGYANNTPVPNLWSEAIDVCPDGYRAPAYDNRVEHVAASFAQPYALLDGLEMVQSLYVKPEQERTATPYGWLKNLPYPGNPDANWTFGYYADGFFDRGPATINVPEFYETHTTVQYNGQEGYDGLLIFNPTSLASLFLPATGFINPSTGLEVPGNAFSVNLTTRVTGYPTRTINMYLLKQPDKGRPYINTITQSGDGNLHRGESIRCVVGEKKDITSDGKCVVFYAYGYNDRSDQTDQFIPKPQKGSPGDFFSIPYGATGKWNTKQNGSGITYLVGEKFTMNDKFTVLYAIE